MSILEAFSILTVTGAISLRTKSGEFFPCRTEAASVATRPRRLPAASITYSFLFVSFSIILYKLNEGFVAAGRSTPHLNNTGITARTVLVLRGHIFKKLLDDRLARFAKRAG